MTRVLVAGERERADTFARHLSTAHQVLPSYRVDEAREIAPDVDCIVALEPLVAPLAESKPEAPIVAVTDDDIDADARLSPNVDAETLVETVGALIEDGTEP